jgi:hypothetical protein
MLYIKRTKDSPSRVRFRPLPRLTFRFRVRPPGRASSYSRPVLGAAAIYALTFALARGSVDGKAANCERPRSGRAASTWSSQAPAPGRRTVAVRLLPDPPLSVPVGVSAAPAVDLEMQLFGLGKTR